MTRSKRSVPPAKAAAISAFNWFSSAANAHVLSIDLLIASLAAFIAREVFVHSFGIAFPYGLLRMLPYFFFEAAVLTFVLRVNGIPRWIQLLTVASTFLQIHFLFSTRIDEWAPDIRGHLDYIQYLADHGYVPPEPSGWQRQQPFLYYEWCALALNAAKAMGIADAWSVVRLASRAMYLGYAVFSVLLIRRFSFSRLAELSSLCVVLFWPCAYMISTRTNSDIGFMFFFMASAYELQRWHDAPKKFAPLSRSVFHAGCSLLSKAMGVMSFLTIGLVALRAILAKKMRWKSIPRRYVVLWACIAAVSFGGYFGRIAYANAVHHAGLQWFANVKPGEGSMPGDASVYGLVYFNAKDFLREPVFSDQHAVANEYTYLDFMFRTLLYGTEIRGGPVSLYQIINLLWLVLAGLALRTIVRRLRGDAALERYVPVIAGAVVLVVVAGIQRGIAPDNWLSHGRRIYPLVTLVAVLAGAEIQRLQDAKRPILPWCWAACAVAFAASSTLLTIINDF